MDLGLVGLGRMGYNMALRLLRGGHRVVAYNRSEEPRRRFADEGGSTAASLGELVASLAAPRVVWMMLPAGEVTESHLWALCDLLSPGDLVVDGANSYYKDTLRRAEEVLARGLRFADVGVSGGIWGLTEGYSLMVGGEKEDVERLRPALETLAPAPDRGWGHVGPVGAGHFVKMIHNGIEYGLMQAYAEGFAILQAKSQFALDLAQIGRIWQHGSVVRSWLLELVVRALEENPGLDDVVAYVADSGEGRWTVLEAIEQDLSAPVITESLLRRLRSRERNPFADRLLAVLRAQFGGHEVRRQGEDRGVGLS